MMMNGILELCRSELLSLTLEAEKQSARHGQAAADAAAELARYLRETKCLQDTFTH